MARSARVGLLVLVGLLLFLGGLFLLARRTFLLSDTFFVRTAFFNVAGLLEGSNVQYQGVNVGRVEEILLPSRPGGKIEVRMAIDQAAARLVRTNTRAQVQTDGLVGNQIIVLVANPVEAPTLREGGAVEGVEPFSLSAVTDRALESADRIDAITQTLGLIVQDVRNGEGSLGRILYDPALYNSLNRTTGQTEQLMATLNVQAQELSATTQRVAATAERATENLNATITGLNASLNGTDGSIGRFLNDPAAYDRLVSTVDSLQGLTTSVRAITRNVEELSAWGSLGAFRFSELMEAGKHNFLFKRYFERRGYQEQAPFEIRERALRASQASVEARERALFEWEQRLRRGEPSPTAPAAADTARTTTTTR